MTPWIDKSQISQEKKKNKALQTVGPAQQCGFELQNNQMRMRDTKQEDSYDGISLCIHVCRP